jgi:hypothetical protein
VDTCSEGEVRLFLFFALRTNVSLIGRCYKAATLPHLHDLPRRSHPTCRPAPGIKTNTRTGTTTRRPSMAWTMAEAEAEARASQEGSTGAAVPPRWKMTIAAAGKFERCGTLFRLVFFFFFFFFFLFVWNNFCSCHVRVQKAEGSLTQRRAKSTGAKAPLTVGECMCVCIQYTSWDFAHFFPFPRLLVPCFP